MIKQITLQSLIENECCNLLRGTECLGVDTYQKRFKAEGGPCWIIDEGTQCDYFVICVLPLAPELTKKYTDLTLHVLNDAYKDVKECKCGKIISSEERKCNICKAKVRRLRNKRYTCSSKTVRAINSLAI